MNNEAKSKLILGGIGLYALFMLIVNIAIAYVIYLMCFPYWPLTAEAFNKAGLGFFAVFDLWGRAALSIFIFYTMKKDIFPAKVI